MLGRGFTEAAGKIIMASATIRQQIIDMLSEGEWSVRDLSQALSVMEKDIYSHLGHVAKSVRGEGRKLVTTPARCRDCDFSFADRQRFTKPGKCPRCRGSHIRPPRFSIS